MRYLRPGTRNSMAGIARCTRQISWAVNPALQIEDILIEQTDWVS
jgi:hypothetical protein